MIILYTDLASWTGSLQAQAKAQAQSWEVRRGAKELFAQPKAGISSHGKSNSIFLQKGDKAWRNLVPDQSWGAMQAAPT